ncbi:MAG: alpha/beta hydrolase, partial [Deltaproteobacteria bacterium]|nr:alpha/beta hydrolase [Deltaproteobacteria bacterium]
MSGIRRIPLWRTGDVTRMEPADPDAFVTEVPEPELHLFPAATGANTGIAAVICPGGGYGGLALGAEGHLCAAFLASVGITGLVLQYRLPFGNKAIPNEDMHSALTYARTNAAALGFCPDKLGVVGFSAGGHLAAMASTVHAGAPVNTRPDFSVLFYPVISMEKRKRGMTRINLLGRHPADQDVEDYSCHLRVDATTPPALLLLCDDDPMVPPRHSVLYY